MEENKLNSKQNNLKLNLAKNEDKLVMKDNCNIYVDKRIMEIFLSIGISAHLQGYQYLKEAIKLVMQEPECINSVTKTMYPRIAEKCDATACRVERGIRHALETSFAKGKMIKLNGILGLEVLNEGEKPTNSEFVALLADIINLELK